MAVERWGALLAGLVCGWGCMAPAASTHRKDGKGEVRIPTGDTLATSAPADTSAPTASAAPTDTGAPAVSAAEPNAAPEPTPSASARAEAGCPARPEPAGFTECHWAELTGAEPCEAICQRPRRAVSTKCCESPVEIVVLEGSREVLRRAACSFVPPDCAHAHGHGNMDGEPRLVRTAGRNALDLVVVEGGCEMRATMHGYVPPGVAAWTGCEHERYRWNGRNLALVPH